MADDFLLYSQINCLESIGFIGGTDYTLSFNVVDDAGAPQDIGGATISWKLSPFGQDYAVLTLAGTITGTSTFDVFVPAASTLALSGKFTQQPILNSFFGQTYRLSQGTILIAPAIQ